MIIGSFIPKSVLLLTLATTCVLNAEPSASWWKGNLHTHSLWSDGNDYPESIIQHYKDQGYQFLTLTDHNVLALSERWIDIDKNSGGRKAFDKYLQKFGSNWVEIKRENDKDWVRLKPYSEFQGLFNEAGRFLLMPGEEISDQYKTAPIHLNVHHLQKVIPPQRGESVTEVIQNNVDAVLKQREETGIIQFVHLNHPNFGWAITAEELMQVKGLNFFEVYNGHPSVRNYGDEFHASTERMWDIILTWRLAILNLDVLYGVATDDSHEYHKLGIEFSNTGRGWVMVQSRHLTPEGIIRAMESGQFYSSSGVTLESITHQNNQLGLKIAGEPGVTYLTQFIGTRRNFDRRSEPITNANGAPLRLTHRYSEEVGMVLATVPGLEPAYQFTGDELYVRAKVISSKLQENPYQAQDLETAWVQPHLPE